MADKTELKKMADNHERLSAHFSELKKEYEALAKLTNVMADLRGYCELHIPTDMISAQIKDLDVNKIMVQSGRASVLQRIEYFINTPLEQIVKQYE